MRIRNTIYTISLLLILIIDISGQEIKVTEFRSTPRDISARENAVYDANGDACALVKTRTGLQNLKFTSDLEIRKIENHDGEYWLWVSPNTKQINIEAEGIARLEYKLPAFAEEYNVYIIFLTTILPDKVLYKDINSIRIETKPKNAEIHIDKIFLGLSPLDINISSDTLHYEVRKDKFIAEAGTFVYSELQKKLFIDLKKNPIENRMFLMPYIGEYGSPFFGIQTGKIGKTGWYISVVPPIRSRKSLGTVMYHESAGFGFGVNDVSFTSIVGASSDNYTIKLKESNNTFYNNFRLKGGFTQKIFKNTYLLAGLGIAEYTQFYRLEVIPKSIGTLIQLPIDGKFFGKSNDQVGMFCIETGLIYRLKNTWLMNFNISTTGFSHYFKNEPVQFLLPLEGTFGIGYNF